MKIVLNDLQDVQDLVGMLDPELLRTWQPGLGRAASAEAIYRAVDDGVLLARGPIRLQDEPTGLPDDIDAPQAVVAKAAAEDAARTDAIAAGKFEDTGPSLPEVAALAPDVDSTGRRWDGRIDSSNKALNANGSWRARRNHGYTPEEVEAIKAEVLAEQLAIDADEEPVATETHALPNGYETLDPANVTGLQATPEAHAEPVQPASTVDLQALVAASQEAAMDAKDGLQDLLAGCRDFTSAHGTAEFNALKAAVAPRGDAGASLQEFTPAERRLMLACIANYPKPA